jgi:hypothetical protein
VIDAEQVWQRSDLSGADLPGPLEAASRRRLKESLVAHTHRLAVIRPQSLANFRQADFGSTSSESALDVTSGSASSDRERRQTQSKCAKQVRKAI